MKRKTKVVYAVFNVFGIILLTDYFISKTFDTIPD